MISISPFPIVITADEVAKSFWGDEASPGNAASILNHAPLYREADERWCSQVREYMTPAARKFFRKLIEGPKP